MVPPIKKEAESPKDCFGKVRPAKDLFANPHVLKEKRRSPLRICLHSDLSIAGGVELFCNHYPSCFQAFMQFLGLTGFLGDLLFGSLGNASICDEAEHTCGGDDGC
jgi:hypothetical protein